MLTDKIKHINPDIIIEENGIPTVIVPVSEYRNTALFFKNDPQLSFDYLVCMTGMDWGDSMGVINLLESTIHGHRIFLKTSTTDRENPELPSISDIWETANLNEREVFDFFGIRFFHEHRKFRRLPLFENAFERVVLYSEFPFGLFEVIIVNDDFGSRNYSARLIFLAGQNAFFYHTFF